MIQSRGRSETVGVGDVKKIITEVESLTKNVEIEIYSFCSKAESKNIQLVFKYDDGTYVSFEDIVSWKVKPENFTITMDGKENPPYAENGSTHTGSYLASGKTNVEHSFEKNPIFVCQNDEYGSNFATTVKDGGFMKVHCKTKFENNKEFTVAINNIPNVIFKPAKKTAGSFTG